MLSGQQLALAQNGVGQGAGISQGLSPEAAPALPDVNGAMAGGDPNAP